MNDYGPVIWQRLALKCLRDTIYHDIDGAISIGMRYYRYASLQKLSNSHIVVCCRVTEVSPIILVCSWWTCCIWFRQISSSTLGRAIENKFDAADAKTTAIIFVSHDFVQSFLFKTIGDRKGDNVLKEGLILSRCAEHRDTCWGRATILKGSESVTRLKSRCPADRVCRFFRVRCG